MLTQFQLPAFTFLKYTSTIHIPKIVLSFYGKNCTVGAEKRKELHGLHILHSGIPSNVIAIGASHHRVSFLFRSQCDHPINRIHSNIFRINFCHQHAIYDAFK